MSTVYVTAHWLEPDPDEVSQRILSIARELEETEEPMLLAGELTRADIAEHFATETDPQGRPWDPWAESYEAYALANGSGKILNLEGHMEGAATSPSAYTATRDGLWIDTSGFPEWWAWNNFGAARSTKEAKAIRAETRAKGFKQSGFGMVTGENWLPERQFIGLSAEAIAKIEAMFVLWFEGSITIGVSKRGQFLVRGKGGRFVKWK